MAEYVSQKNKHLRETGYEDGFAEIAFSVNSSEEMHKLINVSLGIEQKTSISNIKTFEQRFGTKTATPFRDEPSVAFPALN